MNFVSEMLTAGCSRTDCPTGNGGCSEEECFCNSGYHLSDSNTCDLIGKTKRYLFPIALFALSLVTDVSKTLEEEYLV